MEIAANKKFTRFLLSLALIAFLSVAFFGTSQSVMGMGQRGDGNMGGCLFDGNAEICTMSFSQHLSSWQGMFTTTLPKIDSLILLASLLALAIITFVSQRPRAVLASEASASSAMYAKQNFRIPIFNPLQEAFSQGILNPKIY